MQHMFVCISVHSLHRARAQSVMGVNLDTLRPEPTVEGYTTLGGYSYKVCMRRSCCLTGCILV